jgi:uroporphyrinogen III methyltransferase/synthase
LENGLPLETPAAVIACGTTPHQRSVAGCLADIVEKAVGIEPPAITVVGETARLSQQLAWFDHSPARPLLGLRVVNTRPQESDRLDSFSEALSRLGADVIDLPAFRLVATAKPAELDERLERLAHSASSAPAYDWLLFTSANAVKFFMERLWQAGYDGRILAGVRLGAVGNVTAAALAGYHLKADLIPQQATGRSLAQALGEAAMGTRVLAPRSAIALPDLVETLIGLGALVDPVVAYEPVSVSVNPDALQVLLDGKVDLVAFFSPSAVAGLRDQLTQAVGEAQASAVMAALPAACIGPTTAAAARQAGAQVVVVPELYTAEGLVEALVTWRSL